MLPNFPASYFAANVSHPSLASMSLPSTASSVAAVNPLAAPSALPVANTTAATNPVQQLFALSNATVESVIFQVGSHWIPFMIDTGCSSSACSIELASKLQQSAGALCESVPTTQFRMANGAVQQSAQQIQLFLQQLGIQQSFYVLNITIDAILGMDFLLSNGVQLDFATQLLI